MRSLARPYHSVSELTGKDVSTPEFLSRIGRALRQKFSTVVSEDIPDDMILLLARLEKSDPNWRS